jgi:hypothetical protein
MVHSDMRKLIELNSVVNANDVARIPILNPVRFSHNLDFFKLRGGLITTDSPQFNRMIMARTDHAIER